MKTKSYLQRLRYRFRTPLQPLGIASFAILILFQALGAYSASNEPSTRLTPNVTISTNAQVDALLEAILRIKPKEKDRWDKLQVLASLLTPLAVAWLGFFFARKLKSAEDESRRTGTRVQQATLMSGLIRSLTSENSTKRAIAAGLLRFAIRDPKELAPILSHIAQSDPDDEVRSAAKAVLEAPAVEQLIKDLFSDDRERFERADRELSEAAQHPPGIYSLMQAALLHPQNEPAVKVVLRIFFGILAETEPRRKFWGQLWKRTRKALGKPKDEELARLVKDLDEKYREADDQPRKPR